MAVKKKMAPSIQSFIEKGADVKEGKKDEYKDILLSIHKGLLSEVDSSVDKRLKETRTGWILDAIARKLKEINSHVGRV